VDFGVILNTKEKEYMQTCNKTIYKSPQNVIVFQGVLDIFIHKCFLSSESFEVSTSKFTEVSKYRLL